MPRPDRHLHSTKIYCYLEGPYQAQRMQSSHTPSVPLVICTTHSSSSQIRKRISFSTCFSLWHNIYTASTAKRVVEGFAAPRWPQHVQVCCANFCSLPDTEQTPNSSSCVHKLPPFSRGLCKGARVASEDIKHRGSPPFPQTNQIPPTNYKPNKS